MVPVVVSAGLAVGVFAGLLFGLGTGDEVQAGSRVIIAGKATGEVFDVGIDEYEGPDVVATPDAGPIDAPPVDAAPTTKLAHIALVLMPPGVTAEITADGKPVDSEVEVDITDGAKTVELVVKAAGFRDFKKQLSVGKDDTLTIELVKRSTGSSGTRPPRPPKPPGGGLIDI